MPKRAAASTRAPPTRQQKSALLCVCGLFFLTAGFALDVMQVRPDMPFGYIFGAGVVSCLICGLMSGHLSREDVKVVGELLPSFMPKRSV